MDLKNIPILGGEKEVDFENWKYAFEKFCTDHKIENSEKLENLWKVTENEIKDIVLDQIKKKDEGSYDEAIKKIETYYLGDNIYVSCIEFMSISINDKEQIIQFNNRFSKEYKKIKDKAEISDKMAVSIYIKALTKRKYIKEKLLDEKPEALNLVNAMELAKSKDRPIEEISKKDVTYNSKKNTFWNNKNYEYNKNKQNRGYMDNNKNKHYNNNNNYFRTNKKRTFEGDERKYFKREKLNPKVCFRCQQPGHIAKNCKVDLSAINTIRSNEEVYDDKNETYQTKSHQNNQKNNLPLNY